MNHKVQCNNTKTWDSKIDLSVLTLMYIAGSLGVIDRELLSFSFIIILKYSIVIMGSLYFIIQYIRKYYRGDGRVALSFQTKSWVLYFLWILFSLIVIVSQSYNGYLPLEGIAYLIFNPIVFFIVIPMSLTNPESTIIKASFYGSFIYLLLSAFYEPINFGSFYTGVTYNPNSIGQLSVQAAVSSFCIFLYTVGSINKEKRKTFIYLMFFIISLAFIFLSQSRASLMAFLAPTIFTIMIFIISKKIKLRKIILPSILFVIIYFLSLKDFFEASILGKFNRYNNDNLLSGRDNIWNMIINDITLLGHGPNYFLDVINKGAHNSILEVFGNFGLLAGGVLALFYLASIIISFKYAILNRKKPFFYVPLMVVLTFIILSMTESMFGVVGKSMTLVYFNIIGLLIFRKLTNRTISVKN
ncbi:O-antigen ligase family protein [Halobacillus sp. A1]|uniref:O-antigen ligase family protein n=1 Tax=Halobacillus sp. A1 TaxID=2880262 RepID=UPI0020A66443|nr:O-antigen ligase family protein [Halobacillus sp. A1]MCP3032935.1 O-antigen ligase family protein [Halobacillus sp. A1]